MSFLILYHSRGYEVQFLVVDGIPLDESGVPIFNAGAHEPLKKIPLAKEAGILKEPSSFCYRFENFHQQKLPDFITIDSNLLDNALKEGISYIVITIAYTMVVSKIIIHCLLSNKTW